MSAYTEYKYGLITEAEYNTICRKEAAEHKPWWNTYNDDEWDEEDEFQEDEIDEF